MSIYLLTYIMLLVKTLKKNFFLNKSVILFILVVTCFSYYNGSDWRMYEKVYVNNSYIERYYSHWENGFKILIFLFRKFNFSFMFFMIGLKICTFFIVVLFFKKFSNNFWLSMLLYIPTQGYVLFIDNPLRQMIGIAILLIGSFFSEKKLFYIFFIITAFQFHRSSIVFLIPLLFSERIYQKLLDYKFIMKLYVFLYLIVLMPKKIYILFANIFSNVQIINFYIRHYIYKVSEVRLSRTLIVTGIFLSIYLFTLKRKKIKENCKYSLIFFNFYLIISIFSSRLNDLLRFNLYFSPYFIIILTTLLSKKKNMKKLIILIEFINSMMLIKNSYKYIPYTNYLFQEYKNYKYRKNYHFKYYEERGEKWEKDSK